MSWGIHEAGVICVGWVLSLLSPHAVGPCEMLCSLKLGSRVPWNIEYQAAVTTDNQIRRDVP